MSIHNIYSPWHFLWFSSWGGILNMIGKLKSVAWYNKETALMSWTLKLLEWV
jgi:hypothetical protein